MSEDEAQKQLAELERTLGAFEQATKAALGFTRSIPFQNISFDVSTQYVIADMSPLAFFHLVEKISDDGPLAAIVRLYDRLMPLLTCRHKWVLLRRADDKPLRSIADGLLASGSKPYICRACTAYAFAGPGNALPVTGRELG